MATLGKKQLFRLSMKIVKTSYTTMIRDMPVRDRPRERLKTMGAESLSERELLAVVISTGTVGKNVTELAGGLLQKFGSLENVGQASLEELMTIKGIGKAKASQLKAIFELARRWHGADLPKPKNTIKTPEDAYAEMQNRARGKTKEYFWAIFLDIRSQIIKTSAISVGSLDSSIVHPRELFREAISAGAASFIAAHNHPSGNPSASREDIQLSKRLKEAGELMGIEMVDHIILGEGCFVSLKREGLL